MGNRDSKPLETSLLTQLNPSIDLSQSIQSESASYRKSEQLNSTNNSKPVRHTLEGKRNSGEFGSPKNVNLALGHATVTIDTSPAGNGQDEPSNKNTHSTTQWSMTIAQNAQGSEAQSISTRREGTNQ